MDLKVVIEYVPLKFGLKEKILAIKYFRTNPKILRMIRNPKKTDEEKLSSIREAFKEKMDIMILGGLHKISKKEKYKLDKVQILEGKYNTTEFIMSGPDKEAEKWEKTWEKKVNSLFRPEAIAFRILGIRVKTERLIKDE